MRKLKPICSVSKGVKQCQLAAMPHLGEGDLCLFHARNSVLFPRVKPPVVERENLLWAVPILRDLQKGICCICGYRMYRNQDVDIDHLWPFSMGGKNNIENLGVAHAKCNQRKFDSLPHDPEILIRIKSVGKHFVDGESTKHLFSVVQQKEICQRYQWGESTRDLGKSLGVGHHTIYDILIRQGTRVRTPSQAKTVANARQGGKSSTDRGGNRKKYMSAVSRRNPA